MSSSYEGYEKELESLLPSIMNYIKRVEDSAFVCSDGHLVTIPRYTFSDEDEARLVIRVMDLFISCNGTIIYTNPVGSIELDMAYVGCMNGFDSRAMSGTIRDVLNYFLPPPNFNNTTKVIFELIGKMMEKTLTTRFIKDPLHQVLFYYHYYLARNMRDVVAQKLKFICFSIFIASIKPKQPPIGIAYCTTFDNLVKQDVGIMQAEIIGLRTIIETKILNHLRKLNVEKNYQLCKDMNTFTEPVKYELESVEKVLKKYGIIRVAFPLS